MASRVTRSRRQFPQQQEQQSRARWTTFLTEVLADLMVEQVRRGNRQNSSFSKKGWRCICDDFCKRTGLRWDKEQLKNRFSVLRRQYVIVKSLLDQNDFSLDESTGTILASNEAWADYIKKHADADAIKSSGCPIYKQLCVIFSEPVLNGKHHQSADQDGGVHSPLPCQEPLSTIQEESLSESEEVDDMADDPDVVQPTTPSSASNRKRGRRGIDDAIAGAILEMAAASKLRTAAVKQSNARYSIANCIRELDEVQGVEEHVYFAALDLFNSPVAREIFLCLKGDKRLTWLRGKCVSLSST